MTGRNDQAIERIGELEQEIQRLQRKLQGARPPGAIAFPLDVLVISVGANLAALPVPRIEQVAPMVAVAPIPHAPRAVRGVVNFHRRLVPVVDLHVVYGAEAEPLLPSMFLVFVRSQEDEIFALVVDEIHDVRRLDEEPAADSTQPSTPAFVRFVFVEGPSVVPLIDPALLLSAAELNLLHEQLVYAQEGDEVDDP
jgi:chemotaxis signal transduction protein